MKTLITLLLLYIVNIAVGQQVYTSNTLGDQRIILKQDSTLSIGWLVQKDRNLVTISNNTDSIVYSTQRYHYRTIGKHKIEIITRHKVYLYRYFKKNCTATLTKLRERKVREVNTGYLELIR